MKMRLEGGFGKKKGRPPTRLEQISKRPFTHEDIVAHIDGTAVHNDLAKPEVESLVRHFKELAERRSDNDAKKNALMFGGIIRSINDALKRTGN
jgi:hypothetical protein